VEAAGADDVADGVVERDDPHARAPSSVRGVVKALRDVREWRWKRRQWGGSAEGGGFLLVRRSARPAYVQSGVDARWDRRRLGGCCGGVVRLLPFGWTKTAYGSPPSTSATETVAVPVDVDGPATRPPRATSATGTVAVPVDVDGPAATPPRATPATGTVAVPVDVDGDGGHRARASRACHRRARRQRRRRGSGEPRARRGIPGQGGRGECGERRAVCRLADHLA
jgi:hypothetical protein